MDQGMHVNSTMVGTIETRVSPSAIAVLDAALERVSALDYGATNPFVNHAPMACEALATLSLDSEIGDWVARYQISMRQGVTPVTPPWRSGFEWKELVGNHRLLPEWIGYFDQTINDQGWRAVVELWVPRLMPGLISALFHGVIRTSHAVRAIDVADTEARRAELARALGNWAVWFAPGASVDERAGSEDPQLIVLRAAARGARCYLAKPNIVSLHGVTGAMAVHLLAGYLYPPDAGAAVAQLRVEHRSLYRGVTPMPGGEDTGWNHRTAVTASRSYDAHQIKLVEACHRGFHLTGDSGFARAAETVTSTD
jgi:hypothetical protein